MNTPTQLQAKAQPPESTDVAVCVLANSASLSPVTPLTGPAPFQAATEEPPPRSPVRCQPAPDAGATPGMEVPFEGCPISRLAEMVARMLTEIVAINDKLAFDAKKLTRFHSRAPPGISILAYLQRIIRFCSLDKVILLVLLYFIDLLSQRYTSFNLNTLTVHRFIITSVTVASKGLCDSFCTNSHYAKVGGITKVELNLLELEFLTRVDYRIVPRTDLVLYYAKILERNEMLPPTAEPTVQPIAQQAAQQARHLQEQQRGDRAAAPAPEKKESLIRSTVRATMNRFLSTPSSRPRRDIEQIDADRTKKKRHHL